MTLIDYLPLIRGWTWRRIPIGPVTVLLNQELIVYQPPTPTKEIGWTVGLTFTGNDCYLGLRMIAPGIDTAYGAFVGLAVGGAVLPPPAGNYLMRYYQPNPLRTWGQYYARVISMSYPIPFYGPVRLYMTLLTGSTEPYATGYMILDQIIIQDRNLFLKDLRKVFYGRWAPLMDLIGSDPILMALVSEFEERGIPFEEKEIIEPPGIAR